MSEPRKYGRGMGRPPRFPWHDWQVGESRLLPLPEGEDPRRWANSMGALAQRWGKARAIVFKRKASTIGVRVTRVA